MDRLLVLKLTSLNCEAEAWLNGMPIARVGPGRPVATLPVHEYTVAGNNRVELVIGPAPAVTPAGMVPAPVMRRVADGPSAAQVRMLLPRIGNPADESSARSLAQLDWAVSPGEVFEQPLTRSLEVALPVNFPRWRWLEAPVIEPNAALQEQAFTLLQTLAFDLGRGEFESFVNVTRLRFEELALAYQRTQADEIARWREAMQGLHAAGRLKLLPLKPAALHLRRLAGGRLLDCMDTSGEPALRTAPDAEGRSLALPLRAAVVEGKIYVLR